MGAPQDGVQPVDAEGFPDMIEDVEHPAVGASQDQDRPGGRFQQQIGVLGNGVGYEFLPPGQHQLAVPGGFVRTACVPGDEMKARRDGAGFLPEFKSSPGLLKVLPALGRADEEWGYGGVRRKARQVPVENRRVGDDPGGTGLLQDPGKAARMVKMAVAQQDGRDAFQLDAAPLDVVRQGVALAGIEKNRLSVVLDEGRESVLP